MKSIAVVILNYNGLAYLQRFLPSVYAGGAGCCWDLYVADNCSVDGSVEWLAAEGFEHFEPGSPYGGAVFRRYCIRLPENYGFAEGYNRALAQIEADYYVLLNSDVEVAAGWLLPLFELMERLPHVAACQPKIRLYDAPERFEHAGAAGGFMDALGYPFCRGRIFDALEEDRGQYDKEEEVFWASGAAMFVRAELYGAFGGLDGSYFAHMEEIDLCWRWKRGGYSIMVCPRSVVWHVGGGTLPMQNPRKDYLNFRNNLTTLFKNVSAPRRWALYWLRLCLDMLALLRFLLQKRWSNAGAVLRAHGAFWRRLPATARRRRYETECIGKYALSAMPNRKGMLRGSIVWQFFAKGRKRFSDLKF